MTLELLSYGEPAENLRRAYEEPTKSLREIYGEEPTEGGGLVVWPVAGPARHGTIARVLCSRVVHFMNARVVG